MYCLDEKSLSLSEDREEKKNLEQRAMLALRQAGLLLQSERAQLARDLADQARKIKSDVHTLEGRVAAMAALLDRADGFERTLRHPQKVAKGGGPKLRQPSPGSHSGARKERDGW